MFSIKMEWKGKNHLKRWITDESGATAIEYSLIAAGIALGISTFIFAFGEELYSFFGFVTDALDGSA